MTIRMTQQLIDLIDRAAAQIDRDRSYIARATLRRLERTGVIQGEINECITKSGPVYVSFRDFSLDSLGLDAAAFRAALYVRCTEALGKPGAERFVSEAVEGRDYVVVNEEK